jgi:hypothetical protein
MPGVSAHGLHERLVGRVTSSPFPVCLPLGGFRAGRGRSGSDTAYGYAAQSMVLIGVCASTGRN